MPEPARDTLDRKCQTAPAEPLSRDVLRCSSEPPSELHTKPWAGVLSTAGKLVFGGSDEGYFFALDAETGREVWRQNLGGIIRANPVTYLVGGRQLISIAAGNALFTFALERLQAPSGASLKTWVSGSW